MALQPLVSETLYNSRAFLGPHWALIQSRSLYQLINSTNLSEKL